MKKRIGKISLVIYGFLIVCTIISTIYYRGNLPIVSEYAVQEGEIHGEMYQMVVPENAVYKDVNGYFVYRIKEMDDKTHVVRCSISVIEQDENYAAISRIVGDTFSIALSPSKELSDGQEVRLKP